MGKTKIYLSLVTLASLSLYGENISEKEIDFSKPAIQLSSCKIKDLECQKKAEDKIDTKDLYHKVTKKGRIETYLVNIEKNLIDSVAKNYKERFSDLIIRRRVVTDDKKYANLAYDEDFTMFKNRVATIALDDAVLYDFPNDDGKKISKLEKSEKIILDGCNEYEWCKLQNKEKYIRKYRLKIDHNEIIAPSDSNVTKELKHPFGNPFYVDASTLAPDEKAQLFEDENGNIFSKNSILPKDVIVPITPLIENVVTVEETVTASSITTEKETEPVIDKQVEVIPASKIEDANITTVDLIDNNTTNKVEIIETKEIVSVIKEELSQPTPIVIIPTKTNENEILEVKKEDVVFTSQEGTEKLQNEFKLKEYFSDNFIGLAVTLNSLKVAQNNEIGTIPLPKKLDEQGSSFILQVGTKLKEHYVISGNYEALNLNDIKINSYFVSVDYKLPYNYNPYLGVSLGGGELEWKTDPLVASVVKPGKIFSMLYGIQGGVEYPVEDNWSIFSQLSYQKFDFKTNLVSTPAKGNITHDDKKSLGIGLRHSF